MTDSTHRPNIHPITDEVLFAQRKALKQTVNSSTPIEEQRRIARELLWHAMFSLTMLDPHVEMKSIVELCRDAINEGVKLGEEMGNHRL